MSDYHCDVTIGLSQSVTKFEKEVIEKMATKEKDVVMATEKANEELEAAMAAAAAKDQAIESEYVRKFFSRKD